MGLLEYHCPKLINKSMSIAAHQKYCKTMFWETMGAMSAALVFNAEKLRFRKLKVSMHISLGVQKENAE